MHLCCMNNAYIPHDPLVTELSIYKQQVAMYEQHAKFDLTLREQKMDEQMRMLIQDCNKKEENLKNELHSVKLQLNSTIKSNMIIEEIVTALKHKFKQLHDHDDVTAVGAQNPFYLRKAKVAQPALYDGDEILKTHHVPISVTSSEEDLEIAEITRQKMNEKMNDLVVGALKQRVGALKANSPPLPILPPVTVYPPNTPVHLVPRTLPTTSQVNIEVIPFFNLLKEHFEEVQRLLVKEVRAMKAVFENMEAEVDQNAIDKKCGEIKCKNLLIMNEKLIANCIAQDVFYTVTDSALFASRFHDLSTAYNVAMTRVVELEFENSNYLKKFNMIVMIPWMIRFKVTGTLFITLQEQLDHFKTENEKVKQHYQELFNSIKVTRVKTIKRTTSLQTKIENLKTQLNGKMPCVTNNVVTPKVSTIAKYAIKVEFIPASLKNNRNIHHHYLNRLRDILDTFREIVEQGVRKATKARRSKSKSNTINNKTLSANSVPKKKVEDHHRKNKSKLSKKNRVDSSTSAKQTWKPTGKVFTTVGYHWKPTGRLFPLGAQCPLTRNTKPKVLPVKQWKPTGRIFPLGDQCPLTRSTKPKVLSVKQWKPTGRIIPLGEQCPLVRPTALNNTTMLADTQANNIPVESNPVVQIVLWYLDSGCSKHMTGDRSRLRNFVKKFIGTVRFGNDHFGAIMGYGDYVIGDSVISRVYYVEGLGHNLFSVGQFCDSDLEVAFRKHTCFVRDLDGVDLIKGCRGTNLYTISVEDMMRSSPICLLSKASKNKSWLWHRRLNHLNFGTLNDLARKDLVRGLPRLKFEKDHLCSACQLGKSKKATHKPKMVNTIMEVLYTLHMDLCGPMRVQSINRKKYIHVMVDDYSRFTWVKFLRSRGETPEFVVKLIKQLQVCLNRRVRNVRTDNGTEFVNKDLTAYYESVGITHKKTVPRTPQLLGKYLGFNPLIHSFCALSTLRRSGLRTASTAAKPWQGDSSEVYLITGRIPMVAAAGQKRVNPQPHAHTSYTLLKTS
ncbi:retrovirus-related pol polyprotein from transposon TNT 1-94 [Tanacetum coccineum]